MNSLNNLEQVAQLFKPTFCRLFIVYGSNIICSQQNAMGLAKQHNEELWDEVSLKYCITDKHAKYFLPSMRYAFSTVYSVGGCDFCVASYWQFQIMLTANRLFKIGEFFRYPTNWDKIDKFMTLHPANRSDLVKWCTLIYGDSLSLIGHIGQYVDKFDQPDKSIVKGWIQNRWLSVSDISIGYLSAFEDVKLSDMGLMLKDFSYLSDMFSVYSIACGTVGQVLNHYQDYFDAFHDYIGNLEE